MPLPLRAALYARTSTIGQGQDPGLQVEELNRLAQDRGWMATEYIDEGVSGVETSRPALDRMMADVQAGKIDAVVVWKLDRLGRSLTHLLDLLDRLTARGVAFVSVRDAGLDTTTTMGRLMFQLLGAFAEFERSLIRERVIAGLARAKERGTKSGRPIGRPPVDLDVESARIALKVHGSERKAALALGVSRTALQRRLAAGRTEIVQGSAG